MSYNPTGYIVAAKGEYVAMFAFSSKSEMRELALWLKAEQWVAIGHKIEPKVDHQPHGFTPSCPVHHSDMLPSKHSAGSFYCNVVSNGEKCKQRYNDKGHYVAKERR